MSYKVVKNVTLFSRVIAFFIFTKYKIHNFIITFTFLQVRNNSNIVV